MQHALLTPEHAEQHRKALRDAADAHRRSYAVAAARGRAAGHRRRPLAARWAVAIAGLPTRPRLALPKR
jgi:hypothetical protein